MPVNANSSRSKKTVTPEKSVSHQPNTGIHAAAAASHSSQRQEILNQAATANASAT
jgi:hypothetical protein